MSSKTVTLLTCLLFLHSSPTFAANLAGKVVGVIDSDTIEVLHNSKAKRIRLSGIDCPEKGQAYGKRAKQAASDLAFGKEVTVQTYGHDKYKRTIGDVILPDGTNVNHTLVKERWGWITLVNRSGDRHAVLTGVNGGQRDFSRPAETVH